MFISWSCGGKGKGKGGKVGKEREAKEAKLILFFGYQGEQDENEYKYLSNSFFGLGFLYP